MKSFVVRIKLIVEKYNNFLILSYKIYDMSYNTYRESLEEIDR